MSQVLTDTHCHLDLDAFSGDREQVVARARKAGLIRILNPGINLGTSKAAIRLAEEYSEIYAAAGIHPNNAMEWDSQALKVLNGLADHPKVVAIGEIGLDYYRDRAPKDMQKQVILEQLALAAEKELPVVLHNRQASSDILSILTDWHAQLVKSGSKLAARPGVLHSYSATLEIANEALLMGFVIGITGPITFRNAAGLQALVTALPIERLLIETDAPFLTPHPWRGQRNEPSYVKMVAEKIAELKGLTAETVASITTANADQLFHWKERHID